MFKYIIGLFLTSSLLFSLSLKDNYDLGKDGAGLAYANSLFADGNYSAAGEIYLDLFEGGDTKEPAYHLGLMMEEGKGVNQDCTKAGYFYLTAVKAGSCQVYDRLINMYESGTCVTKNMKKALRLRNNLSKCLAVQ